MFERLCTTNYIKVYCTSAKSQGLCGRRNLSEANHGKVNLPNTVRIATVSSQGQTGFDIKNNAVSADLADAKNYMEKLLKAIIMCVLFSTVCEGIVRQHRTIPSL